MDRNKRLIRLRAEGRAFVETLSDEVLDNPVPAGPKWTLRDLTQHLGRVHSWAGEATRSTEQPPRPELQWPTDAAGMADKLLSGLALLTVALDGPSAQPAWSFAPGHGTLGFWQRRQLVETAIHRWDAQGAVGQPQPLEGDVAADGLDELVEVLVPLRIAEGKLAPGASVTAKTSDEDGTWAWGQGDPIAEVSGSASDLLLFAWGRLDADAPALTWSGDVEGAKALLGGVLTP